FVFVVVNVTVFSVSYVPSSLRNNHLNRIDVSEQSGCFPCCYLFQFPLLLHTIRASPEEFCDCCELVPSVRVRWDIDHGTSLYIKSESALNTIPMDFTAN